MSTDRGGSSILTSRWSQLGGALGLAAAVTGMVVGATTLGLLAAVTLINAGLSFAHYRRDGQVPTVQWRFQRLRGASPRRILVAALASLAVILEALLTPAPAVFGVLTAGLIWLALSLVG